MRIPQLVAGALVARQASVLPSTFCSPECPSCKADVADFDGTTTSCVANSSFIQNCGLCQSCVMTYAIENGGIDTQSQIEQILVNILNLCENTSVSTEIEALQSQASRMSVLGVELATTTDPALASMTGSITITTPPTSTPTSVSYTGTPSWMTMTGDDDNTSWRSVLSTATWASYYYAHKSAESASLASVSAALEAKHTATTTTTSTSKPTQSAAPAPLSPTWIAGPIVGSVMGMCTVLTVIFFTRRKHRKEQIKIVEKVVEVAKSIHDHDNDSAHSPSPPEKAQLHSECLPAVEVENTEVHELPAVEPVGSELNTPMEARMREEDWPVSPALPLSPLPLLFAMSEMRDQRVGGDVSPRHDTFYHP